MIEEKIFQPLGMTSSTAYIEKALKRDFAQRYSVDLERGIYAVPNKKEPQMHPAGGTVSTVHDLSNWVIANLNLGQVEGEQIFPKAAVRQTLAPQIQLSWQYYKFHRYAYALGVYHSDYDGDLLIHHFGGAIHVSFMPEHDLGVIVLTNNVVSGAVASHRLAALTYDYLLGKDNFEARIVQEIKDAKASKKRILEGWAKSREDTLNQANPSDPTVEAADIEGVYISDRLGAIEIFTEAGILKMRYGAAGAVMTRLDGNSFTTLFDDIDFGIPVVFNFKTEENRQVLDWGGRIFVRQ